MSLVKGRKGKVFPGGGNGEHWGPRFSPYLVPLVLLRTCLLPELLQRSPCSHSSHHITTRAFHQELAQLLSAHGSWDHVSWIFSILPCPVGHIHTSMAYKLLHLNGMPLSSFFIKFIQCSSFLPCTSQSTIHWSFLCDLMQVVYPFIITIAIFWAKWEYFFQVPPAYTSLSFHVLPGSENSNSHIFKVSEEEPTQWFLFYLIYLSCSVA